MSSPIFLRCGVMWAVLAVFDLVSGIILPSKQPVGGITGWVLLANAITAGSLSFVGYRSHWRGWRLGFALAAIPLSISLINLIEGMLYLKSTLTVPTAQFALMLAKYSVIAPLSLWVFSRAGASPLLKQPNNGRSIGGITVRLFSGAIIYFVLYFAAGMIIFPFVRDFYATLQLPPIQQIMGMQLFLRGPLFFGICVLLCSMLPGSRSSTALAVGAVFALLSGVAPLILPQPFFPDAVRWIHFWEVTGANFVFGVVATFIWMKKSQRSELLVETM